MHTTSDTNERQSRKDRYHAVLRTVGHQTSPAQGPGVRTETVRLILAAHGTFSVDGVNSSIRAAVEQDDLHAWLDREGRRRLTLMTEPDLRRLARYLAEELVDQQQLARVNRRLAEARKS